MDPKSLTLDLDISNDLIEDWLWRDGDDLVPDDEGFRLDSVDDDDCGDVDPFGSGGFDFG